MEIFELDVTNDWTSTATLRAMDETAGDRMGWSVAIDNANVVTGAPLADPFGNRSGKAYLFDLRTDIAIVTIEVVENASTMNFVPSLDSQTSGLRDANVAPEVRLSWEMMRARESQSAIEFLDDQIAPVTDTAIVSRRKSSSLSLSKRLKSRNVDLVWRGFCQEDWRLEDSLRWEL